MYLITQNINPNNFIKELIASIIKNTFSHRAPALAASDCSRKICGKEFRFSKIVVGLQLY